MILKIRDCINFEIMYRRIIVVAFLFLSFMCLSVNGQTAIEYSYYSAGNRTSRFSLF